MKITIKDIKNNIDSSYYSAGLSECKDGKVLEYTIEDEDNLFIVLSSVVDGGIGAKKYKQNIKFYEEDKDVYIDGKCNCPIRYNCKHVASTCLKYLQDLEDGSLANSTSQSNEILIDQWLENLQKDETKLEPKEQEYFLTYKLFESTSYSKDELQFYKSKLLKNGAINQGTHLDKYKVINSFSYKEMKNSEDENILAMANSIFGDSKYRNEDATLKGTLGYILITEMIKTGRCYFDENKKPLQFKEELFKPIYDFKLVKDEYSLISNIDITLYKVIDTKPPLILDKAGNCIFKIDLDIATYKKLLNTPKIKKKDIARVYTTIGKVVPTIDLITPDAVKTTVINIKPTPKISLKYTTDKDEKKFNFFKIEFVYDKYIVNYNPRDELQSFYEESSKIELKRDLAYEESVKSLIEDLGFNVIISDNTLCVILNDYNKQSQLKIWKQFLGSDIIELEKEGWIVEYDEEFSMKFESNAKVAVESKEKDNLFSLSFNLEFNGISQPIAPLVVSILEEFDSFENMPELINIEISENHFVEVPTKQMQPIIKTIVELLDKQDKKGNIQISAFDSHLIEFMDEDITWRGSKDVLNLSQKLRDFKGIEQVEPSKVLNATLRDYQQDGLNWLQFLFEFKFAGILADDMGLGKTLQTLAHLSKLKEDGKLTKPSLIIMPTSLIANWKNETKKFAPNLSVLSLHGSDRAERFCEIENHDILLTTYPLVVRDKDEFDKHEILYVILDEAQKIKNPKTKMTLAIKAIHCEYRLALSGTPIENHLGELWSIYSFLMPGFLDTLSFFKKYYQVPIEKENDFEKQTLLNKRVQPFMIRRTKEKVAHELPAKTEIIKYTQFDEKQSKLYESIRVTMEQKVREAVSSKGLGSSHITILDALLKLRQVCCDPKLLKIEEAKKVHDSAKLDLFLELIDELLEEGRKILVFSQFTSMLAIIEEKVIERNINYTKLTGSTKNREEAVDKFTKGGADIFLISLKAGGVGLNLVEADTVIHYDPWWNPAVENQATDRAYRIGQKNAVFVYKLIVENTIEQKILELQQKKKELQNAVYDNTQKEDVKLSGNELLELLK